MRRTAWMSVFLTYLMISTETRAGYPANTYVYKSAVQEGSSSHIFVGKLRAFHQLKSDRTAESPTDRREMNLYVAELEVVKVEKGEGLQAGDVAYLRFHTPKPLEEVEHPFPGFGCGLENYQATPAVGDDSRIYVDRNDDFEYVADYPASFFRISKKELEGSASNLALRFSQDEWMVVSGIAAISLSFGFLMGRRRGRASRNETAKMLQRSRATIESP